MSLVYLDKLKGNEKYKAAFEKKLRTICSRLDINPNWAMLVFRKESEVNPKAVNATSGASGLFQLMPATAKALGVDIKEFRAMDALRQLDWFERYYWPFRKYIDSYTDMYLATFYPKAKVERWPDSHAFPPKVHAQNRGLDLNKDGTITLKEFKEWIMKGVPDDFPEDEIKKKPLTQPGW